MKKTSKVVAITEAPVKKPRLSNEQRFRKSVDKADSDRCENWLGGRFSNGYGMFTADGITHYAHRYAYQLHHKLSAVPDGLYVMHTCDNRLCTAKAHLKLGTAKDNSLDMATKGRSTKGRTRTRKLFTEEENSILIAMAATGATQYRIAKTLYRSEPVVAAALKRCAMQIEAKRTTVLKNKLVSILQPLNESMQTCIADLQQITKKAA